MGLKDKFIGLWKGGKSKKQTKRVKTDMQWSKYSADLSAYASACKQDSKLQSFDNSLMQRTYAVVGQVKARAEPQSIPLDSLMDVYGFVLDLNQDALRVIIESREDIWKNEKLRALVELYFKSSARTLDFCNIVDKCVKKTEISQLLIHVAMTQFETNSLDTGRGGSLKEKHVKTLEELAKVKATGDPFDEEFVKQYKSVYDEQVLFLRELCREKAKIDKKQRNVATWSTVGNVLFFTAYVTVLVLSVVAAAVGWPQVVGAVASGVAGPIDSGGKWCSELWKNYEADLKRRGCLVSSMEKETTVMNRWMETIRILVDKLKIDISTMLETVDVAVERENEEEMRIVMKKLKTCVDDLTEKMENVGQSAAKCSNSILSGRLLVLDHIAKLPTSTS